MQNYLAKEIDHNVLVYRAFLVAFFEAAIESIMYPGIKLRKSARVLSVV